MRDKAVVAKERRSQGLTLKEIGEELGVTKARIGQLLKSGNLRYCGKHTRGFRKNCRSCSFENKQKLFFDKWKKDKLMDEILAVKDRNRTRKMVNRRVLVVKRLIDQEGLNFLQVGRVIERTHADVIHLYKRDA